MTQIFELRNFVSMHFLFRFFSLKYSQLFCVIVSYLHLRLNFIQDFSNIKYVYSSHILLVNATVSKLKTTEEYLHDE